MNLNISFKHMDPSDGLREYVREKSEKFKKFFQGKITVGWNFVVEKQNHIAHCHLLGDHMDYFGEATTQDMHASVDEVIDKMERQLRKHKEIVTNHKAS